MSPTSDGPRNVSPNERSSTKLGWYFSPPSPMNRVPFVTEAATPHEFKANFAKAQPFISRPVVPGMTVSFYVSYVKKSELRFVLNGKRQPQGGVDAPEILGNRVAPTPVGYVVVAAADRAVSDNRRGEAVDVLQQRPPHRGVVAVPLPCDPNLHRVAPVIHEAEPALDELA